MGKGRKEIVALQRFTHEDLPEKAKTLGTMAEVHEYFQEAENFEIDPQSATVALIVYFMVRKKPVRESVILPLQRQKKEIRAEQLMEEIDALKEKILIFERMWQSARKMDENYGDFEEETGKKIRRIEDHFWKAEEKI